MKKILSLFVCLLLLVGCKSDAPKKINDSFIGSWEVGAIYSNNKLIDVNDISAIKNMYDAVYVMISDDSTFLYTNIFFTKGECVYKESDTCFLKSNYKYRMDYVDGQVVEKEMTTDNYTTYIATLLDDNTLKLEVYDAIIGGPSSDDAPMFFVRTGKTSQYIQAHKTAVNK